MYAFYEKSGDIILAQLIFQFLLHMFQPKTTEFSVVFGEFFVFLDFLV